MEGRCLCGSVAFCIKEPLPDFYQCHCSLCRRLSGSASDTATFVKFPKFSWLRGEHMVNSYVTESGYRSDFCQCCGSTVPHLMQNGKQVWVPAGLLDASASSEVVAHLFVGSKAGWDEIGDNGRQYEEMPDMNELNTLLHKGG